MILYKEYYYYMLEYYWWCRAHNKYVLYRITSAATD